MPALNRSHDLCDSVGADIGAPFGGVDPSHVGAPVELRQGVEELAGGRVRIERRGHIGGEVGALRSFGNDDDFDAVPWSHWTVPEPGRTEREAPAFSVVGDRASNRHRGDSSADVVLALCTPGVVRIKRHRDTGPRFRQCLNRRRVRPASSRSRHVDSLAIGTRECKGMTSTGKGMTGAGNYSVGVTVSRNALLVVHLLCGAAWLGANFTQLFASRTLFREADDTARRWARTVEAMAKRYYNVVGIVLATTGVLMVIDGPYEFRDGFVLVGIGTVAIGALLGVFVFAPTANRIAVAAEQGDASTFRSLAIRYRSEALLDTTLVILTVVAMVWKWRS